MANTTGILWAGCPQLNPLLGDVSLGWAKKTSWYDSGHQDRVMKPPCETRASYKEQRRGWHCTHCWFCSSPSPIACVRCSAPHSAEGCSWPSQGALEQLQVQEFWAVVLQCTAWQPARPPPVWFQGRHPVMCCWWITSAREWICGGRYLSNFQIIWSMCLSVMPTNISWKSRSPNALTTCDLQLFKEKYYSEPQI